MESSPTAATKPLLNVAIVLFGLVALGGTIMLATAQSAGEGPRAAQAKVLGNRVVSALDDYRRLNRGKLPSRLDDLRGLPLLPDGALNDVLTGQNPSFEYVKESDSSYALSFKYNGPGENRCEYVNDSEPNAWQCKHLD